MSEDNSKTLKQPHRLDRRAASRHWEVKVSALKSLRQGSVIAFSAAAFSMLLVPSAAAQDTSLGSKEFTVSCAVCHGANGKGDGELAKFLTIKPADLTLLSKKNGGDYPFLRVFQTIDGRSQVGGHGDRPMPIWGDRYQIDTKVEPGTYGSETMVRSRILELVYFIQSIQQK